MNSVIQFRVPEIHLFLLWQKWRAPPFQSYVKVEEQSKHLVVLLVARQAELRQIGVFWNKDSKNLGKGLRNNFSDTQAHNESHFSVPISDLTQQVLLLFSGPLGLVSYFLQQCYYYLLLSDHGFSQTHSEMEVFFYTFFEMFLTDDTKIWKNIGTKTIPLHTLLSFKVRSHI